MKYKTLRELRKAYKSGELKKDDSPVVIDNDCTFVYHQGECVFRADGPHILCLEALDLLCIPWEDC